MTYQGLIASAVKAREKAYTPYSGFRVGAALLTKDGRVYLGCNIENASYSPTCCAERTAFFSAIACGEREFAAIAVVGGMGDSLAHATYPCGVCRQVMAEFCNEDFEIVIGTQGEPKVIKLNELLPFSFSSDDLS